MAFQSQQLARHCASAGNIISQKSVVPRVSTRPLRPVLLSASATAPVMTRTQTLENGLTPAKYNSYLQSQSDHLTVVDFFTPFCGPCKVMEPVVEKLSTEYDPQQVTFAKVNCSSECGNKQLAVELGVKALPTFLLYKEGKMVAYTSGSGAFKLKKIIDQYK